MTISETLHAEGHLLACMLHALAAGTEYCMPDVCM